jgi:hypothetical protein
MRVRLLTHGGTALVLRLDSGEQGSPNLAMCVQLRYVARWRESTGERTQVERLVNLIELGLERWSIRSA